MFDLTQTSDADCQYLEALRRLLRIAIAVVSMALVATNLVGCRGDGAPPPAATGTTPSGSAPPASQAVPEAERTMDMATVETATLE